MTDLINITNIRLIMKKQVIAAVSLLVAAVSCSSVENVEEQVLVENIRIVPDEIELVVGDKYSLDVEYSPENAVDKTVEWSFSPSGIVDVDNNGCVVAMASGEAVITATCGEIKATCRAVVKDREVESVEIDRESEEIYVGETVCLEATVLPSDIADVTVLWSSSDPYVAEVDENGVVSGIAAGEAVITARAGDASDECRILVKGVPVSSVSLDPEEKEIEVGQSFTIYAVVEPENAEDRTVLWSSTDMSVAEVDENGIVTGKAEGVAVIVAEAGGVKAECTVTVVAAGDPVADIKEDWSVGELFDYPQYGKGVVFKVGDDFIKVVSFVDNTYKAFSPLGVDPVCTDTDLEDGKEIADILENSGSLSQYPAAEWARNKGEFWYLPTLVELTELYGQASAVNASLSANGSENLPIMAWSCIESESDANRAYAYVNGQSMAYLRIQQCNVIAVMKLKFK